MREIEIILSRSAFWELKQLQADSSFLADVKEFPDTYEEYLEEIKKKPLKALFG